MPLNIFDLHLHYLHKQRMEFSWAKVSCLDSTEGSFLFVAPGGSKQRHQHEIAEVQGGDERDDAWI